jgi:SAM-dependent methyltransferase
MDKGIIVTVKDLVRPLPGVRRLSLLRQQLGFSGSAGFWERTYTSGGTSGNGSYGRLAEAKAGFLNNFVRERGVQSVIEFGCGDGNQLALANYPSYIGLDVSRAAIKLCKNRFAGDRGKSFFLYDGECFVDRSDLFVADLAISLDVIYHLVEDAVFGSHMTHLFAASRRYVVVYSSNTVIPGTAPWVRHRKFSDWVDANCTQWHLVQVEVGPNSERGHADFFVYERLADESC